VRRIIGVSPIVPSHVRSRRGGGVSVGGRIVCVNHPIMHHTPPAAAWSASCRKAGPEDGTSVGSAVMHHDDHVMIHPWARDPRRQNAFPIKGCQGGGSAEHSRHFGWLMMNIPAIVVYRGLAVREYGDIAGRSSSPLTGDHDAIAGIP
jgi:hypothetical protein